MKILLVTLLALSMLLAFTGANAELPIGTDLTPTADEYPIDLTEVTTQYQTWYDAL